MKRTILLAAGLLVSCGCSTMNNTEAGAVTGGALGAGVGALAGAAVRAPIAGALIGGTVGALAGGAAGNARDGVFSGVRDLIDRELILVDFKPVKDSKIGELVGDKLPMIPKRTSPAPLIARIITGGLCGGCLCASAGQSLVVGAFLGGIGAVVGAFLGYGIRRRLDLHINDLVVAVCEDVVAVGLALFVVSR